MEVFSDAAFVGRHALEVQLFFVNFLFLLVPEVIFKLELLELGLLKNTKPGIGTRAESSRCQTRADSPVPYSSPCYPCKSPDLSVY